MTIILLKEKGCIYYRHFTEMCSQRLIVSDYGWMPNRQQTITWINDGLVYRRIYASLGLYRATVLRMIDKKKTVVDGITKLYVTHRTHLYIHTEVLQCIPSAVMSNGIIAMAICTKTANLPPNHDDVTRLLLHKTRNTHTRMSPSASGIHICSCIQWRPFIARFIIANIL